MRLRVLLPVLAVVIPLGLYLAWLAFALITSGDYHSGPAGSR